METIPRPRPLEGEVLVQVHGCGVCHTDLHVMKGEVAFPTPCVLGHEIAGIVTELGHGVGNCAVGDRVVATFIMPCGNCRHCVRGRDELCETFFAMNRLRGTLYDGTSRLRRADGTPLAMYSMAGLAEYAVVPATDVFAVPESLELGSAAVRLRGLHGPTARSPTPAAFRPGIVLPWSPPGALDSTSSRSRGSLARAR